MLFTLTIEGNFYYLAHLESVLLVFVALIEWHDRRRPWVLGLMVGLAALARPTLLLMAVPLGIVLLMEARDRVRVAVEFAVPIAAALIVTGWWDLVRFGSPLETGYTIAWITAATRSPARAGPVLHRPRSDEPGTVRRRRIRGSGRLSVARSQRRRPVDSS